MKTLKMSLANIQGKLSRSEMRKVMAGSGPLEACIATPDINLAPTCFYGRAIAEVVGKSGWWECNTPEAHEICGY